MGSSARPAKSYTEPKGRETSTQGDVSERGPRISATVEWVIVVVVIVAIVIGIFIYAANRGSTTPGSPHTGAPAPVTVTQSTGEF